MSDVRDPAAKTVGSAMLDAAGTPIGRIAATAVDPRRLTTDWLIVDLDDGVLTALPAFVASVRADGNVIVPFTLLEVNGAPRLESDVLSQELADEFYAHYGLV